MPDMFTTLLLLGLLGPLLAGGLAFILGKDAAANRSVQAVFVASAIAGGFASLLVLMPGGEAWSSFRHPIFRLDGLSALFLGIINFGALATSIYAVSYLPRYASTYNLARLNAATGFFLFGMQATVLAASVFGFLLSWEIMSLAGFFLVIADREAASLKAGLWYFVMAHLGFSCLLLGFLLLAQGNPAATFADLAAGIPALSSSTLSAAFALLLVGFGSKAGLVPLHQWLPHAHPQAPSHSSALMSGVMLKVAVYGFLRLAFFVFPVVPMGWAVVVIVLGLVSAFFGVLHAALETDLKRLLAWSSIENIGLIFTAIGLALAFRVLGLGWQPLLVAALFHLVNHAVFKTGLFLAAGSIVSETHTRDLDALGGLAKRWPWFSGAFLVLALAAAALPPLGTFYAEISVFQQLALNMLASSKPMVLFSGLVLSVLALVGGLAVFTFAKLFSAVFLSKARSDHAEQVRPLPSGLVSPIAGCAAVALVLGVGASWFLRWLDPSWLFAGSSAAGLELTAVPSLSIFFILLLAGLVSWLASRLLSKNQLRLTDTWDCGQPVNARMEYTATGFAAPILFFFRSLVLARKHMHTEPVSAANPWILKRHLEWSTRSIWEAWLYRPFTKLALWLARRIKRLQSGIIQFYLALIVITLVLALGLAL